MGHPFDKELTDRTRYWLSRLTEQVPTDLRSQVEAARQQREVDSVEALIKLCRTFCDMWAPSHQQIRRDVGQRRDLGPQMNALINDPRFVKLWIQRAHGQPDHRDGYLHGAKEGLGPDWFIYHHARSSLALWCLFMTKYGAKDTPGKEFTNTKLDADYAALLHYADALATNETSGSMADLCSWLYLGSKKLFSTSGLDAVLPKANDIRLDAYFIWVRSGRTHWHNLNDWLEAEKELMSRVWERLGVETDKAFLSSSQSPETPHYGSPGSFSMRVPLS